jgi:4-hydroxymandelate oxidase
MPLSAIPREIVAATDYEQLSGQHLSAMAWHYLVGGAADERTVQANGEAFRKWRLRQRVLVDVAGGHTRLSLFGQELAHPFVLAPVAYQRLFHEDGEHAAVLGAGVMGGAYVLSSLATSTLEAVAAEAQGPLWFQLYFQRTREATLALLQRAEAAGYGVIVVTVDAPLAGIRNRELRSGFQLPAGMTPVNLACPEDFAPAAGAGDGVFSALMAAAPRWADIEWLCAQTRLPVLIKGILDADDARQARSCGVAGMVVSNHGGRVLDDVLPSLEALPAVVAAAEGLPVLLDGGVRRGADAFKALALGATAVMVGRPYIHALAVAGALGVAHLVRTLREELEVNMALCGCATLSAITRDSLLRADGES